MRVEDQAFISDTPEEFEDLQRDSPNGVVAELLDFSEGEAAELESGEYTPEEYMVAIHPPGPGPNRMLKAEQELEKIRQELEESKSEAAALREQIQARRLKELRHPVEAPIIRTRPFQCEHLSSYGPVASCIHVLDQQHKIERFNEGSLYSQYIGLMLCGAQVHRVSDLVVICVQCAMRKYERGQDER